MTCFVIESAPMFHQKYWNEIEHLVIAPQINLIYH